MATEHIIVVEDEEDILELLRYSYPLPHQRSFVLERRNALFYGEMP